LPPPAIAFDVTPLQNAHRYRGIGTYVRGLAKRLAAQTDIPIEFWGWAGDGQLEVSPPHRAVWLPKRRTPQYRGAWIFAQLALRQRAGKSGIGVVHVTDPDALATLAGRKLLVTVYDLIPLKQPQPRRHVVSNIGYWSYLNALRRADTLFAISQQTAGDIVEMLGLPSSRILVARPGVDLPDLPGLPTRGEVPGEAGRRGGGTGRPYFLYVGGPNPNKNLALILDAMALCPELSEELRIAGHWLPKQVAALDAQLAASGLSARVRHIGFVPGSELAGLMREATALVIPSLHEGFGLPVAEGLAAGAVVMHSDLPVLLETSAGAALTFAPRSAADLAACLRQAAGDTDLTESLRMRGLERAKLLTWDAAVETTLAAYRAALSK
jgi:glycosyltransferase involved in cell wall biosynthesis